MLAQLEVFEPAACVSGGTGADERAVKQFDADVQWLAERGIGVLRHRLRHGVPSFVSNPQVTQGLQSGTKRLPIATANGRIVSSGAYPTRAELAELLGITHADIGVPFVRH